MGNPEQNDMSTAEAACALGVSIGYLYSLLWAGKLQAAKVDGHWRVSVRAVEERKLLKVARLQAVE